MNRSDFQKVCEIRRADNIALLAAKRWDAAYYLAGYVIECALKACIAKMTNAEDFPEKELAQAYTHDLVKLIRLAKLEATLIVDTAANAPLRANWAVVKDWNESSRYVQWSQPHGGTALASNRSSPIWSTDVAKTTLVNADTLIAKRLIQQLRRRDVPVVHSAWYHFDEAEEWRLLIATPLLAKIGPTPIYEKIQRILRALGTRRLTLRDVTLITPDDPRVRAASAIPELVVK